MAEIFPSWVNRLPLYLGIGALPAALITVFGVWYYFSPEYTDVGYQPRQPVPFSHKLHAGELELDCRYCHTTVEVAATASVPSTQTCMNCHQLVLRESEALAPVRASHQSGVPLEWVRVHKVPEYAFFNHSVHLRAGVSCFSCHGDVTQMEEIRQVEPLSMSWCLECHRNPDPHLRPREELFNSAWMPPPNQNELAQAIKQERSIQSFTDCTTCHR